MITSKSKFKHIPEGWEMVQEIVDIVTDGDDEFSQVDQLRSVVKNIGGKLDSRFKELLGPLEDRIESAVRILVMKGTTEEHARRMIDNALPEVGDDCKPAELANLSAGYAIGRVSTD